MGHEYVSSLPGKRPWPDLAPEIARSLGGRLTSELVLVLGNAEAGEWGEDARLEMADGDLWLTIHVMNDDARQASIERIEGAFERIGVYVRFGEE